MSSPVISVHNLSKTYRSRARQGLLQGVLRPEYRVVQAVRGVDLEIEKGESVAFLGPNGAGKTTTTKILTGLMYPSSGKVTVLGYQPFERKPEFLRNIGLVMGNKAGLNWDLTPRQSFELYKAMYQMSATHYQARLAELTGVLQVEHCLDTSVRRLSLGERMKVELIGAILHDPEVLFLDEPTIGLDVVTKKNVREFLRHTHKERGTTLILTSHDMDDVEHVCDRVVVINTGEKVYDGSLTQLTERYGAYRYLRAVFSGAVPTIEGAEVVWQAEGSMLLKVAADHSVQVVSKLATTAGLVDLQVESVSLEEILADLFKVETTI